MSRASTLSLSFFLLIFAGCTSSPGPAKPEGEVSKTLKTVVPPAIGGQTGQSETPTTPPPAKDDRKSCACVKIYMPVCGSDGMTYGNDCEAECQGVKWTQGSCGPQKKRR